MQGYEGLTKLHEGHNAMVWRARRAVDGEPVVLKVLRGPRPSVSQLTRFRREAAITRDLQGAGIVGLLAFEDSDSEPMMVLRDAGARSLASILADGTPAVDEALQIAERLVEALARVHAARIVHRDLSPSNVLWDAAGDRVSLIDFGISSRQAREVARGGQAQRRLEGTLAYIAPEQTGRMNRSIDYRADYYGLGATLYHLLVGRPPFAGEDALELVHAHIARTPRPPHQVRSDVPEAVSALVMRLLAKSPEDRYQGPTALLRDLASLRAGDFAGFRPGEGDHPPDLVLPEKLYGRGAQRATLLEAWDRVREGGRELLLVAGYSGIGKTALVGEVQKPIATDHGLFIRGKFDQFARGVPYAAMYGAIRGFLRGVLADDDATVELWRDRIGGALGELGALLVAAVPEMGALLGADLPPVPDLPAAESEARFDGLMLRLVHSLADRPHPLVMFLDDLQWADLPSLRLLARLTRDPQAHHLLLIGAYRDNEVDGAHPLALTMAELDGDGAPMTVMGLGPLGPADVHALVADTVRHDGLASEQLAQVLSDRTGGNPFFLTRMLTALADDGLLTLDPESGRWTWDLAAVQAASVDEDIVAFVGRRLDELPESSRHAMTLGSLLGATFDLRELATLAGTSLSETAHALSAGRERGLLVRIDGAMLDEDDVTDDLDPSLRPAYRFLHDRVQQAAGTALSAEQTRSWRLRIARQLGALPEDQVRERLFDLVGHYGAAVDLIEDPDERRRAAEWNLEAGRRAVASAAFTPALVYLNHAVTLLSDDVWSVDHAFALAVHQEAANAAWLATDFERMETLIDVVVDHTRSAIERFPVDEARVQSLMSRNRVREAAEQAVDIANRLGDDIPPDPTQEQVGGILMDTIGKVQAAGEGALVTAPLATDPVVLAMQRIKANVFGAAYYGKPMVAPVLGFHMVRVSLEHGVSPETSFGLTVIGLVLCSAGEMDGGIGFGHLALAVNDRMDDRRLAYRTMHMWNTHLRVWQDPWRDCRDDLREVYKGELAGGDVEFAAFSAFMTATMTWAVGEPLADVDALMSDFSGAITALGQETQLLGIKMQHQAVRSLLGETEDPLLVAGELYDERVRVPEHVAGQDASNLFVFYTTKVKMLTLQGAFGAAVDAGRSGIEWQAGAVSSIFVPQFWFYLGISSTAAVRERPDHADALIALAKEQQEKLTLWATKGPANQAHRLALVEAELARLDGDVATATRRYEDAIQGAHEQRFLQDEALSLELAARFHLDQGHRYIGCSYLADARAAYAAWGARSRVAALEAEFMTELSAVASGRTAGSLAATVSTTATATAVTEARTSVGDELDGAALVKSALALASELTLSGLVPKLLQVVTQAAGATSATLLMPGEGGLRVEVSRRASGDVDLGSRLLSQASHLPASVIRLVARTQQSVVLGDIGRDDRFSDDPALAQRPLRSVLCVPLSQQGQLAAVLYLEHDRASDAFPAERADVVQALAGQATISIQNARLYESLEDKVRERTGALVEARTEAEQERDRADDLLFNILPARVAQEMKDRGSYRTRSIEAATVLFTDFKGFTAASARMTPEALIAELERLFSEFDDVMDRFGITKLKTIGDAYMAIGGAPAPTTSHPVDCVLAALALRDLIDRPRPDGSASLFSVRIGVHTGPLVAGVIGKRRFAYDVWGDTVNTASRMESGGAPGRVNVSRATHALIAPLFVTEARGLQAAKGKGELEMFFVDGIRPELSVDGDGRTPTPEFHARAVEACAALANSRTTLGG
jgi:histidine kinase